MASQVQIEETRSLDEFGAVAHLAPSVWELRQEAARIVPSLRGRTVWMVNSTARGGGVAEMLPTIVALLRDLGLPTEWVVIDAEDAGFFRLTKQLHNLIHGEGVPELDPEIRSLYEAENRRNAEFLRARVQRGDILIVNDPQPMPLASMLADTGIRAIWRCHIGLDGENAATRAAWQFLAPYTDAYHHAVFSAPEYIPVAFANRASVIYPAINPLSLKNEWMHLHAMVGTLANAALASSPGPQVRRPFSDVVRRLGSDGILQPANMWEDIGLLTRPIVTQVSRWDRLKGYAPLLKAFVKLKEDSRERNNRDNHWEYRRRLDLVRLVLAGPEPQYIQDDPEAVEVVEDLQSSYLSLEGTIQNDIAIIMLPMSNPGQNALIVNALQRSSSIAVQNSLREGFGLTITEAMWKRIPVLSNSRACGPRQQVRDRLDGRLVADPEDTDELAAALAEMLADPEGREAWGQSAQHRVQEEFLVFSQLQKWLRLLAEIA
jgi:trehalose synthase